MIRAAALLSLLAAPALAEGCFVDTLMRPEAGDNARVQALFVALAPIEYRKSCGLRDESDTAYFNAVKASAGCAESDIYDAVFSPYLADNETYLFAVTRTDLRADEDFETYCKIIARLDLTHAVNPDGTANPAALQEQVPLLHALRELTLSRRWQQ